MALYRDPRARRPRVDEARRKGEFLLAAGVAILLMKWLPPWAVIVTVAALAGYFALASGRLFPNTLRPEEAAGPVPFGKVAHAGMALVLVVFFRHKLLVAAGAWAILAAGDAAATLVGTRVPLLPLPWNREKSAGGVAAFALAAIVAGACAVAWVNYPPEPFTWGFAVRAAVPAALIAAGIESLPVPVDDNITVPVVAAMYLALYTHPYLLPLNHTIW
jgi:dolichol kinase